MAPTEFRRDLLKRVDLSLKIAGRTIRYLGEGGYRGLDSVEADFAAEKPLAEAAILLYAAGRVRFEPPTHARYAQVVQALLPYARSRQMAWDVLRYPSVCLQLATPHILLQALGHPNSAFDDLLASAHAASVSRGHEVVPYRELELLWLKSVWLGQDPGQDFEEAAQKTALANPIDLLHGTRDDAYAHTHALMYFTAFGNWNRRLRRPVEELLGESATVLARALIIEDYDLAAEALMAWPLTSSRWSPAAVFGFRVLASLEDKTGFLPAGPLAAAEDKPALSGEDKTKHALASAYHTAFVMGMLCALSLAPEMPSPFRFPDGPGNLATVQQLQSCTKSTGAYWERVFQSLAQHEQSALAPLLLDVALIQCSRTGEYATMVRALEIAMANGLANTTLCAQSAEFLSRISAYGNHHCGV